MSDSFENHASSLSSPPRSAFDVSVDDLSDLPNASRCINVSQSGTVRVMTVGGDTVTFYVAAGIQFPVRAKRILATGTTATGIVASY